MKRAALIVVLSTLLPATALAYSIHLTDSNYVVKWPMTTIGFELDYNGWSGITDGSDLAAVRQGAADWNAVGCSTLVLNETGTTTSTVTILTENYTDGHNRLVWIEDSRWQYGSYVLGVTTPVFTQDGRIEEADIAFNGYATSWTTNGSSSGTDVESVAVHELGHFFGLSHVLDGNYWNDPPTMSPAVDPNLRTRDLTTDDMNGACYLYPVGSYSCSSLDDCPMIVDRDQNSEEYYSGQLACSGGSCSGIQEVQPGTAQLGESCNAPSDCANGLNCIDTGGSGSFCASSCTSTAQDCPCDYECFELYGGGGACMSNTFGTGANDCTPVDPVDPVDPGGTGGTAPVVCLCDTTWSCDAGCFCDAECDCACDKTTACDDGCDCDPECDGLFNCAAVSPQNTGPSGLAALAAMIGLLRLRRRRR